MDNKNKCREEINSHALDTAGRWERKIWSRVRLNGTPGNPFLALLAVEGEAHLTPTAPGTSEWNPWEGVRGAVPSGAWASPTNSVSLKAWGPSALQDHPDLQPPDQGTGAGYGLRSTRGLLEMPKAFHAFSEAPHSSSHSKLPPDLLTCTDATKAPGVVQGRALNPGSTTYTTCVTLDKSLNLSELNFLICKVRHRKPLYASRGIK